jgi:hypothetical protein
MADVKPQSPEWWLDKLYAQLQGRQREMATMDAYYRGEHPLPFLTKAHESKMRDEFRLLLEDSRSNFMRLVVDAVEERLQVEGFRNSASGDAVADQDSWAIWQANQLDAESQTAFLEALIKGHSYLSVWMDEGADYPTIAVEDPMQTIVGYVPGTAYRKRAAALKVWKDDWTGMTRANVWLPDGIYKFQRRDDSASDNPSGSTPKDRPWERLSEDDFVANPWGVVSIVPLRNRPRLGCEGESELSDIYRIQNQINGFLFLLALAGYFGAHRQRWAVGLTIMEDKTTGKPVEPFDVAIDKLWASENKDVEFGEFSQTDLDGYIKAIEQKVLHIAVTSRTPRHYLIQEGQSPSGDAIKSAETGLVRKAERKQRPFGEGLEEVMSIARMMAGKGNPSVDSEVVWADADTESEAVITDATVKQFEAGLIPWEAALEKLGYTQTQITRYSGMRAQDALMRRMLEPDVKNPGGGGEGS